MFGKVTLKGWKDCNTLIHIQATILGLVFRKIKVMKDTKFYKTKNSVAKSVEGFEMGRYHSLDFQRSILEPLHIPIEIAGNNHMMNVLIFQKCQ